MEVTLKTNVLKILVYFDLFDYPLTGDEIYRFLDLKTDRNTLMADLNQLTEEKYVFKNNDFYSLKNNPALIKKRITENDYAQPLLLRARKNSKFLFGFPYVKGIFISGSLSKNVAKKKIRHRLFCYHRPEQVMDCQDNHAPVQKTDFPHWSPALVLYELFH